MQWVRVRVRVRVTVTVRVRVRRMEERLLAHVEPHECGHEQSEGEGPEVVERDAAAAVHVRLVNVARRLLQAGLLFPPL